MTIAKELNELMAQAATDKAVFSQILRFAYKNMVEKDSVIDHRREQMKHITFHRVYANRVGKPMRITLTIMFDKFGCITAAHGKFVHLENNNACLFGTNGNGVYDVVTL